MLWKATEWRGLKMNFYEGGKKISFFSQKGTTTMLWPLIWIIVDSFTQHERVTKRVKNPVNKSTIRKRRFTEMETTRKWTLIHCCPPQQLSAWSTSLSQHKLISLFIRNFFPLPCCCQGEKVFFRSF